MVLVEDILFYIKEYVDYSVQKELYKKMENVFLSIVLKDIIWMIMDNVSLNVNKINTTPKTIAYVLMDIT